MNSDKAGDPMPAGGSMASTAQPSSQTQKPPRLHKGRRAVPGDPRIDALINMVLSLTSEVAVLRERLDAHERLAQAGVPASPDAVDAFAPDAAVQQARTAQRERLIKKVCRALTAEPSADR